MKVLDKRNNLPLTEPVKWKSWKSLPVGTVFYTKLNGSRRLLLTTYNALVDLGDPRSNWDYDFLLDEGPVEVVTVEIHVVG